MKVQNVTTRRCVVLGTAFFICMGIPMMAQAGDHRDAWSRGEGPQSDVFESRTDRNFYRDRDTSGYDYYDDDYRGARDYRGAWDYRGGRSMGDRDWRENRDEWGTRDYRDQNQDRYYTDEYADVDTMEDRYYDLGEDPAYRERGYRGEERYRSTAFSPSRESQSDRRLQNTVRQELEDIRDSQNNRIQVKARNGIVTLFGTVEDRETMVDAVDLAYDGGARKVVNNLHVAGRQDGEWAEMGDNELREEIENEIWWSPFVEGERIQVRVRDGVAILQGEVEDRSEIAAAEENAYEAGARRVVNQLRAMHN